MRRSLAFWRLGIGQRYNVFVPEPAPPSQPNPHSCVAQTPSSARPRIHALEATGVLIVAVIILIITLARYWHNFAWSAR